MEDKEQFKERIAHLTDTRFDIQKKIYYQTELKDHWHGLQELIKEYCKEKNPALLAKESKSLAWLQKRVQEKAYQNKPKAIEDIAENLGVEVMVYDKSERYIYGKKKSDSKKIMVDSLKDIWEKKKEKKVISIIKAVPTWQEILEKNNLDLKQAFYRPAFDYNTYFKFCASRASNVLPRAIATPNPKRKEQRKPKPRCIALLKEQAAIVENLEKYLVDFLSLLEKKFAKACMHHQWDILEKNYQKLVKSAQFIAMLREKKCHADALAPCTKKSIEKKIDESQKKVGNSFLNKKLVPEKKKYLY